MSHTNTDEAELAGLGYKQELHRSLGSFSAFAAGFSYISVLTGIVQLFGFGIALGGPAVLLAFPVVIGGQFLIALCFSELAARYPITGSVYSWSKQVGSPRAGWWAGYTMLVTDVVSVAAVALGTQALLPQIWSGFQIIGDGTGTSYAQNAVLLGSILIIFTTVVNIAGVKVMALINNAGVILELLGCALLALLFITVAERGPGVIFDTLGTGASHSSGYFGAFAVAAIFPMWIYFGFDTAGSLAEETSEPRRRAPKAILRAVAAAGFAGTVLVLFGLMAAKDVASPELQAGGLSFLVKDLFGDVVGTALLIAAFTAVVVCCLAIHTGGIRLIYAMGRDGNLPFAASLSRVDARSGAPIVPAVVIGVLAIAILLVNVGQGAIVAALTSVAVGLGYLAYLIVTTTLLVRRLNGWPFDREEAKTAGYFTMSRTTGLVVNVLAVTWGVIGIVNVTWPRELIYNALPPYHWYLQYFAYLLFGIVLVAGLALEAASRSASAKHKQSLAAATTETDTTTTPRSDSASKPEPV